MAEINPQLDEELANNLLMRQKTKRNMAERLNYLMSTTPGLDTNKKLSKAAKVGDNTVARIRNADNVDTSIGNVESIALCFKMSLADFVAEFDEKLELTADERSLIDNLRSLPPEMAQPIKAGAATMADLYLGQKIAAVVKSELSAEAPEERRGAVRLPRKN